MESRSIAVPRDPLKAWSLEELLCLEGPSKGIEALLDLVSPTEGKQSRSIPMPKADVVGMRHCYAKRDPPKAWSRSIAMPIETQKTHEA